MKTLPSFLVLIFWISSWFPSSPNRGAIFLVVVCILGLMAVHFFPKPLKGSPSQSKAFAVFSIALFSIGAFLALVTWAEGTSAEGAIMLFFVLGFIGYLLLIRAILASNPTSASYRGSGGTLLFLIAIWSWTSAIGMYSHRGTEKNLDAWCILAPNSGEYDKKLSSIWDMRLPEIASQRTSPGGSYIWEYHAIFVAKIDGRTEHYNWSKKWMRFEPLDAERNPYLPKTCP